MTGKEINANRRIRALIEQHEEEANYTKEDWKQKTFNIAKSYGESLRHIQKLKQDNKLLLDIIRAEYKCTVQRKEVIT
jgi:hypothetical protein